MPVDEQLNVLVVDDDDDTRRVLTEIISTRGHQTVPATSAEQGLLLLPLWTFQVAFLDQNLPGMEGLVVGEYLRRNNPDMTIALVTGESDRRLVRKSKDLSIRFIAKPFEVSEIIGTIDEYIEAAAERRRQRLDAHDADYAPSFADFADDVTTCFDLPGVSNRIEDRIVETVKRCLSNLRTVSRYTERDRVVALSGLLTAKVLNVSLPRTRAGSTLFEEYDALMRQHGRRPEFGPGAGED